MDHILTANGLCVYALAGTVERKMDAERERAKKEYQRLDKVHAVACPAWQSNILLTRR